MAQMRRSFAIPLTLLLISLIALPFTPVKAQTSSESLKVDLDVGPIYFPHERAEFYVYISYGGVPRCSRIDSATIFLPNGTSKGLTASSVTSTRDLFKITYEVPELTGTYVLVVKVTATIDSNILFGTSMKTLLVSSTLTGLNARVINIESGVATIRTDTGEIKVSLANLNTEVTSIKDGMATIQTDIGEVKASLEAINAEIASLNGELVTLNTTLGKVETTTGAINTKVVDINGDLVTIKTDVGSIQGAVGEIKGDVAVIKTDKGETTVKLSELGVSFDLGKLLLPALVSTFAAFGLVLITTRNRPHDRWGVGYISRSTNNQSSESQQTNVINKSNGHLNGKNGNNRKANGNHNNKK